MSTDGDKGSLRVFAAFPASHVRAGCGSLSHSRLAALVDGDQLAPLLCSSIIVLITIIVVPVIGSERAHIC